MKRPIEKHVFELLKYHDCVIITGLGGFILNQHAAYINEITNKIHPPSKKISFNKNLVQNDGLLANYLVASEKISYDEACVEILKFSRKSKLKLEEGGKIVFKDVGELYKNEAEQIAFQANTLFNFNSNSYGLNSFQIHKTNTPKHSNTRRYMSAAAIIILLLCNTSN